MASASAAPAHPAWRPLAVGGSGSAMAREAGPSSRSRSVVEADAVRVSDLVPSFGFRAEAMTPEDNAAAWREAVGTLFDVDELASGEPGPFRADLTSFALGPVLLGTTRASGQRFRRTVDTIAQSNVDHIILQLYVQGGYEGVAGRRPMRVEPGDICLFDLAQTLDTRATAFENVTMVIPRPKLAAYLPSLEALHGLVIRGTDVAGALIGRHLQALLDVAPSMMQSECEMAVEASIGLITACLRAELHRADMGTASGGEGDRLIRVKQHIEARLGDPGLSGESVARQLGLSRSVLYRLFAPHGGVEAYIRSRRLHRAFFDLTAPGSRVKDVAGRWHLGTEANFNRAFKAAYGIPPKMARAVAQLPRSGVGEDAHKPRSVLSRWMRGMAAPQRR